jgi:hypothetical protein
MADGGDGEGQARLFGQIDHVAQPVIAAQATAPPWPPPMHPSSAISAGSTSSGTGVGLDEIGKFQKPGSAWQLFLV